LPFDFANKAYKTFGVIPDAIISRRNGVDGLSVIDKAPNPFYSDVRVCATVPAYNERGEMIFWYPIGDLPSKGFTDDKIGYLTREYARGYPMYIFPDPRREGFTTFTGHRHAPVIDLTRDMLAGPMTVPLGLRMLYTVYYTEAAYTTKDGWAMMQFMGKKNGWAADDSAIIRSVDDIKYLEKQGYLDVKPIEAAEFPNPGAGFTVAPVFYNPTGGAIYPDAMLFMTMKDGKPLPTEYIFEQQFNCLKKYGTFCTKEATD
jgi:hypothetical protein